MMQRGQVALCRTSDRCRPYLANISGEIRRTGMTRFNITLFASLVIMIAASASANACAEGSWNAARFSKVSTVKLHSLIGHFSTAANHKSERGQMLSLIGAELKRRNAL